MRTTDYVPLQAIIDAAREVQRTEMFLPDHPQRFDAFKALRAALLAFDEPNTPAQDALVRAAEAIADDELEIAKDARVSECEDEDGSGWVQAWVWVQP